MRLRPFPIAAAALALSLLAACDPAPTAKLPAPQEISGDSIAEFCNMMVDEHGGPKGQIFVASRAEPYWFASVRDAFAFTMLPEEPKDIVAIYVNDMGKVANWDRPEPGTWIEARQAVFVVNSDRRGGMGIAEAIPFADPALAQAFAAEHRGYVVSFAEVPRHYPLQEIERTGSGQAPTATASGANAAQDSELHSIGEQQPVATGGEAGHHPHQQQ